MIRELEADRERRVEIQRFVCLGCGRSFSIGRESRRRYSESFAAEVVRRHVEGESYRVIAREVYRWSGRKISPTSLSQMVQDIAVRCKSAWEMSRELRPHWTGYLVTDEKMVNVAGHHQWFYGAYDVTGDVVHWQAVPELTVTEASKFLEEIKALGYPFRGAVTDLDTALTRAVETVYAGKPHQYCLKHAIAAVDKILGYKPQMRRRKRVQRKLKAQLERLPSRKGLYLVRARGEFLREWHRTRQSSARAQATKALHDACHGVLFARSTEEARDRLKTLRRTRSVLHSRKWRAIGFLERHWNRLMKYHRVRGLPRTNNMAESFNRQLERRLKTIESFQHCSTAIPYMNLLVAYLRMKPYTDCRKSRKHLNGKNRLQAAGLKVSSNSWLSTCLKNAEFGNR